MTLRLRQMELSAKRVYGPMLKTLGTEAKFGPHDVVLDGVAAPPKRSTAPSFRFVSIVAKRLDG